MKSFDSFKTLNACVTKCRLCPRLVKFREHVPEKFPGKYWKRPISGFGDPKADLLILGLAPSAQGANRTGRIFTGDASARFLFETLYREGFSNQDTSENIDDGLKLFRCYMTAAVKCVPPQNRPTPLEQRHCFPYLLSEFVLLKNLKAVLALGGFAFKAYLHYVKHQGGKAPKAQFRHGEKHFIEGFPTLYSCYHPSPQNTNTGKLTSAMMRAVLKEIKRDHPQNSACWKK